MGGCFARSLRIALLVVGVATRAPGGDAWRPGCPVPVPVTDGRAWITAPSDRPLLVVASALSADAGPFAMSLSVANVTSGAVDRPQRWRPPVPRVSGTPLPKEIVGTTPLRESPAPLHRRFSIHGGRGGPDDEHAYLPVHARLCRAGDGVAVYVDVRDLADVEAATIEQIAVTLHDAVIPLSSALWGRAPDVDGDGRITVLLTSWLERGGMDGCVRGADFDPSVPAPFGNACDLITLNARLRPGPHLRTVLAHEYAHAATSGLPHGDEESWLDEAMAHLVEDLAGFSRSNLDHRVASFLDQPERYPLVVRDDHAARASRNNGARGSRYLFLRWCADRCGAEALLRSLARGDRTGVPNLEAATGCSFPDLFRGWSLDLYLRPPAGGLGPHAARVNHDGEPHRWEAAGTSPHYVVVPPSPAGASRIEVVAPPEAELQVTVLPLDP